LPRRTKTACPPAASLRRVYDPAGTGRDRHRGSQKKTGKIVVSSGASPIAGIKGNYPEKRRTNPTSASTKRL